MSRYGIIDVGSNTIRLCVYEVTRSKNEHMPNIDTLLNHKAMAGLASYVVDGVMTEQGIKKAVHVIRGHLRNADFYRCREVHVFATACLRNCKNSERAVREIEEGISYPINLLPGEAEAHLGFRGACLDRPISSGVLVDIGGGSVELTRISKGEETCGISLPQGSLSSFSQYVHGLVPSFKEMERIQDAFHALLAEYPLESYATRRLYGIGGSVRSAMKVYGDLFGDGERLGYIEPAHIETMLDAYCHDAAAFAHGALHTIPDRVHTFIPGCLILRELFEATGAKRLEVAKKGVREGYLVERVLGE
ncbi:MAG: exopolyphosphatase [Eggerthellaceae bacterium]|jgi:exopolyphosphatase/guanosine-5'-triphosphate,3'-diphosphate pyrophosphatase